MDRVELTRQRMGGAGFVVSIGSDQRQMPQVGPDQQILDHIKRCRVQPLQIIEKQRKRMLRLSEKTATNCRIDPPSLKRPLRILRRESRSWRLLSYDELQFRDHIHNEQPGWA